MSKEIIKKRGTVTKAINSSTKEGSMAHSFYITGTDDNIEYFAYTGDIKTNEDIILENKHGDRVDLKEGDIVEFEVPYPDRPRVIHIEKIQSSSTK